MFVCLIWCFTPHEQFLSYEGTGLSGFNFSYLTVLNIQGWIIGFGDFAWDQKRFVFFVWLKVTSHVAAHLVNLKRSAFKKIAAARGLSTTIKRLESLAKRRIFELITLTMSLMINTNSLCPKKILVELYLEYRPSLMLLLVAQPFDVCFRDTFLKKQVRPSPIAPADFNLWIKPTCQTQSNALLMSKKTTLTSLHAWIALQYVLYKNVNWLIQESPGINPDWSVKRRWLSWKWLNRCLKIYLSKSLYSELRREIGRLLLTIDDSPF